MYHDHHVQSVYKQILKALAEALSCLDRLPSEGSDAHEAERSGMFQLGLAGGLAFDHHLPGIESEALFDDISDAAERRDLGNLARIRQSVQAELGPDGLSDGPPPATRGLDWASGPLQMLAVFNEADAAQEEGDAVRYSLMAGFLVGLLPREFGLPCKLGSLRDAVLAAYNRSPEMARSWVEAESIEAWILPEELAGSDDPPYLLKAWLGMRLAAAHRFSCPTFFGADDREIHEYYEQEEASIQRAQNFGKRIAVPNREDIWVPTSYSLNRALVLESLGEDLPIDDDREE